jgi:hypothetical protein
VGQGNSAPRGDQGEAFQEGPYSTTLSQGRCAQETAVVDASKPPLIPRCDCQTGLSGGVRYA